VERQGPVLNGVVVPSVSAMNSVVSSLDTKVGSLIGYGPLASASKIYLHTTNRLLLVVMSKVYTSIVGEILRCGKRPTHTSRITPLRPNALQLLLLIKI